MAKKYFGTDGIRGTVNSKNINGDMFFKFGLASGTYFKTQKKKKQIAIIAKDTRLSGYTLEPALVSGLTSAGMHVYTLGPLPTNGSEWLQSVWVPHRTRPKLRAMENGLASSIGEQYANRLL